MKRITILLAALAMVFGVTGSAQAYTFATLDVPGAMRTYAWGINDSGDIVGEYRDGSGINYHGFVYDGSTYTTLDVPGARDTYAHGVNNSGDIVGYYYGGGSGSHGFVYDGSTYTTLDVDIPGAWATTAWGINDSGDVVGRYREVGGLYRGFVYDGSRYTTLDVPGATETTAYGINDSGVIVGHYRDGSGYHGFVYDGSTYTTLDVPGANVTQAHGVNDSGDVVGRYNDSSGNHGFVYDGSAYMTLDVPDATYYTYAHGINDSGDIVGEYRGGGTYGFIACVWECEVPPATVTARPIQTVSNFGNSTDAGVYRLVAGKDLIVRVSVELPSGSTEALARGTLCLDKDAAGVCNANFYAEGTAWPEDKEFTGDQLGNAENTLNFYLKGLIADGFLTPGTHTFSVEVEPDTPGTFSTGTTEFTAEFQQSKNIIVLPIAMVMVNELGEKVPPDLSGGRFWKLLDFVKAAYPVDEERVRFSTENNEPGELPHYGTYEVPHTINPAATYTSGKLGGERLVLVLKKKEWVETLIKENEVSSTIFMVAGIFPNMAFGRNPLGAENRGVMYYSEGMGNVVFVHDKDGVEDDAPLTQSVLAHEMGHQLGLGEEYCWALPLGSCMDDPYNTGRYSLNNPPPFSWDDGDQTGNVVKEEHLAFDVGEYISGRKALFGIVSVGGGRGDLNTIGFMGSGYDANCWTTPTEYEYLYNKLTKPAASGSKQSPYAITTPREVINVMGVIAKDGTVLLEPFLIDTTSLDFPLPTGTTYAVEFRDGLDALLDVAGFDLDFGAEFFTDTGPEVVDTEGAPFSITVDLPAGTESVTILEGASPLAMVVRSANAPVVEVTNISGSGDVVDIIWAGSDADGDTLLYSVFYSPDGVDMEALAVTIPDNSLTFDSSEVSDVAVVPDMAFIRVQASDGFNYSEVEVVGLPLQPTETSYTDIDGDGSVNAVDVQLVINEALGVDTGEEADINGDGSIDAVDVQLVINAALGITIDVG